MATFMGTALYLRINRLRKEAAEEEPLFQQELNEATYKSAD
jgi:hypothetical protein